MGTTGQREGNYPDEHGPECGVVLNSADCTLGELLTAGIYHIHT